MYETKKFSRGIYSELTTNYRGGNRFHPSVRFNARLSSPEIINAPLSSDSENEIETSLRAVEIPRFFKFARRLRTFPRYQAKSRAA